MARLDTDEVATHWFMIQSTEVATPTVHIIRSQYHFKG